MSGFDRAQAAYDAALPPEPRENDETDVDCERCGNQAVCPDCVGT